jgi:uncharacterized membrane protein YvlD (DUF360 family)
MHYLLQQVVISYIALYLTMALFPSGITINGGFFGILYASVLLVLGFVILRPVLNIFALPFNIATIGLFSIASTVVVIFLISVIDKDFGVHAFQFQGVSLPAINVPSFYLNIFLSYLVISVTIQLVHKLSMYIFDL